MSQHYPHHDEQDQHDHGHHHHHAPASVRVLVTALLLTAGFSVVEAIGGWISGSLALLGDAGHMFTDASALGLAALAGWLGQRPPSARHSYGFGRLEVLAAMLNALLMVGLVTAIAVAAVDRLLEARPVEGATVTIIAAIGLIVNLLVAWVLTRDSHNMNVRAALLHVMGDLLGSVAALISGAVIMTTGWTPIDPLLSILIVGLILNSSLRLLRESLHALLDGVPLHIHLEDVGRAMAEVKGVRSVHDLHIWSLSAERIALSAHVVIDDMEQWPELMPCLHAVLHERFHIDHPTLQPEFYKSEVVTVPLPKVGQ